MEGVETGAFMISACVFCVVLEHPGSPVHQAIAHANERRALMGLAMGLTAVAIIYSPWGKQSGAHFNPSVTLTFLRLGKIRPRDAVFYMLAQFVGGVTGVSLAALGLRSLLSHPSVNYVATLPGGWGVGVAFGAEFFISFVMMSVILRVSNSALARYTGLFAGALAATYIGVEAPISGMSMNPARTFGSAMFAQVWTSLWLYFTAPPLGMLLAAQLYLGAKGRRRVACAKLHHQNNKRCIFCGAPGEPERDRITRPTKQRGEVIMKLRQRTFFLILAMMTIAPAFQFPVPSVSAKNGKGVKFTVRIENISDKDGQVASNGIRWPFALSPGLWVTHEREIRLFREGSPAVGGLEAQAEDGNPSELIKTLEARAHSGMQHGIFSTPVGASGPGPIGPGGAYQFSFMAKAGMRLSAIMMFGQSNDWFYAPEAQGIDLFSNGNPVNGDITSKFILWDAGTEVNEELGVGPNQGPRQKAPNTGPDEHGAVNKAKESPFFTKTGQLFRITITPQDAMAKM